MTVSAPYYGESTVMRTPPPDLPSLLLKERIVYLGLPLFSDDDAKRQLGMDVTELIIAQLLYLEFEDPEKPIYFYINSTGTSWYTGDAVGFETEAFAICDTISYIKPPVHTICIGQAMGTAAVILSSGTKGQRAALPHASIVLLPLYNPTITSMPLSLRFSAWAWPCEPYPIIAIVLLCRRLRSASVS